jgi:hypothetical protein
VALGQESFEEVCQSDQVGLIVLVVCYVLYCVLVVDTSLGLLLMFKLALLCHSEIFLFK